MQVRQRAENKWFQNLVEILDPGCRDGEDDAATLLRVFHNEYLEYYTISAGDG